MINLRDELLTAFQEDNFLQIIYKKSLDGRNELVEELVELHNQGLVDIISSFKSLCNKPNTGINFFSTRFVLEESLPRVNAPIQQVMECILHLFKEAGPDLASGSVFIPFIDFCAANPSRPEEALKIIEDSINEFADLLIPTIIAGTRLKVERYLDETIRLSQHKNIEVQRKAAFALGRIEYPRESNLPDKALSCLESIASRETSEDLLGNTIKSAFHLYKYDNSKLDRIKALIDSILLQGQDITLHAASEVFNFNLEEIPEVLLDSLMLNLLKINPKNMASLDNIDYGLFKLIRKNELNRVIEFIEALLLANSDSISLATFDSVIREIIEHKPNILSRLLTKWFLQGDKVLCEGIYSIVDYVHGDDILLSVEPSELEVSNPDHIIFIARKSIGYLFTKPVTAASVIVSLIKNFINGEVTEELSNLLFYLLLIGRPDEVENYLNQQIQNENFEVKTALEAVLKKFESYFNDLKSVGYIPELRPSQSQQDAYYRRFSHLVSESMKKAEKKSVFLSILPKSVLLYGRKSVDYVHGLNGQVNRIETPLHTFNAPIKFSSFESIDPFGLDHTIRTFRAEQTREK